MTVATRLAVMREGRLAQVGEPREVYDAPTSRYTAEFIGDVNIMEGVLADPEAGRITMGEDAPPVEAGRAVAAPPGAPVAVALRPEKLVLERADAGPAPAVNTLEGTVEDIAYMGDVSVYRVRLADGRLIRAIRTNRVRLQSQTIVWEDAVRLSWDPQAVVVLTG